MKELTPSTDRLSTRDKILHTIKAMHEATVENLASAAEISPVTVRHHLNALLAEGLVTTESIRRKVGRPHHVYRLTESGQELFPQKYFRLSSHLLAELKRQFPAQMVNQLFNGVAQAILDEHRGQFEHLPFEAKLSFLVKLLGQEGFLAHWEQTAAGSYQITEYSCPYLSIGEIHTEVCGFDKQLMLNVLQTEVEQHSCMLHGDTCCQFTIQR